MTSDEEKEQEVSDVVEHAGRRYRHATSAARYLGISRNTFYRKYKGLLHECTVPTFTIKFYDESELDQYKGLR